jgi:hypothetical protein
MRRAWAMVTTLTAFVLPGCGTAGGDPIGQLDGADPSDANSTIVRTDWWFAEPPVGDQLKIVAYTGSSECVRFERLVVDETYEAVAVEAYVDRFSDLSCTDDYTIHAEDVHLSEPIGGRRIIGCVAPQSGLRAWDVEHPALKADCSARIRPDVTVP